MDNVLTKPLPISGHGHQALGWWGIWTLIATEGSLFTYLLFSHAYLGVMTKGVWAPEKPSLHIAIPSTLLLLASSWVFRQAEHAIRSDRKGRTAFLLTATLIMGAIFIGLQLLEWHNRPYRITDGAYASSYFTTTGFHLAHVLGGLLMIVSLLGWTLLGKFDSQRHAAISIGALYWHFVDAVWLAVFTAYDLWPYFVK